MSNPLDPAHARTAIENLMFTYAERIDAGDFKGLAALFAKATSRGPAAPRSKRSTRARRRSSKTARR